MPGLMMELEQMERCIAEIREREPRAKLIKNNVGNLAILNESGLYLGWIEIYEGVVVWDATFV